MEKPILRASESDSSAVLKRVPRSGWLSLGAAVVAIALWYLFGPANGAEELEPRNLLSSLRSLATHPLAPLAVLPAFLVGSLVFAPVTGMVALCALLFDPWVAILSALGGILLATAFNHRLGSRFHNALMRRVPDAITSRIDTLASSSDAWTLAGLRLIPIAPFSLINLVVGASGIGLRKFMLGTLIALTPTTVIICLSVDRARAVLAGEPVFNGWILAALGVAGVSTVGMRLRLRE
jgi:phospholipase D1/2